mmetsp:Transcript_66925/g.81952  ORF Transcript_66925/g.81952 Transcript_66925/m.81952 type:complete len:361 (-) Transcript_66925:58-1140(-)
MPINYHELYVYKVQDITTPLDIKYHVFIPKQSTLELSKFIKHEYWGKNNINLYVYLDYIWRTQLIDNNVKLFRYNNKARILFNTGLHSRNDNSLVYLLLERNNLYCNSFGNKAQQKWRISSNKGSEKNKSFVTANELTNLYHLNYYDLPKSTEFDDIKFDPSYQFLFNLDKKLLKKIQSDISEKIEYSELKSIINKELINSVDNAKINPNTIVKYLHICRDSTKYITDILLPLTLNVNNKTMHLCLIARINARLRTYKCINIIKKDVGIKIARVFGRNNTKISWLKSTIKLDNNNTSININSEPKSGTSNDANIAVSNNNTVNISLLNNGMFSEFSSVYMHKPLMYIATILPLRLPELKI